MELPSSKGSIEGDENDTLQLIRNLMKCFRMVTRMKLKPAE